MNIDLETSLARFGLEAFRPGQREVIEAIVSGQDCMCIMPTGGGKSLCYQLPSVIRPGLTIVVSPLIALMKDQVDALARRGIEAALINSTLSQGEQNSRLQAVASGQYQMVYVAPERLRNSRFLEAIRATPIQLLAVDEAHCISQWGHDFRPDYARIGQFRELLGGVQTVALTATATPRVRDDIVNVLRLQKHKPFMSGFARPNLHFGVVQLQSDREKEEELEGFLQRAQGSGIIYSATRKRCDALVEMISKKLKISVGAYHAGLMPDQRRAIQERFMKNDLRVIVATNAFGMGIDKPDLRFVVHYNMPGSLEAYYQEAGRAGRDMKQSQCVMLYSFQDRHIQEFFIDNSYPERSLIEKVYDFLLKREEDPIELTLEEIRDALGLSISPEAVGSCLQILGRTGVLDRLEMGGGLAMVKLDSNLPTLVDLLPREAKVKRTVMRLVERAVGDRRNEEVYLHPRWLLQESGMQRDALNRTLRELSKLDEFDYVPPFRGRAVHFRKRDVAFNDLEIDFGNLRKRKEAEYDRLNQVVSYAQSPLCRQARILSYFGDKSAENCGQCDRCGRSPGWPKFNVAEESTPASQHTPDEERSTAESETPASPSAGAGSAPASPQQLAATSGLEQVVDAIQRIHGRLGKHLLSQYLCGSQNAKVQKLNLHKLASFGLLEGLRQADGIQLIEAMLSAGVLRQQEVNRNRPTISVSPELMDVSQRRILLENVPLTAKLTAKLAQVARKTGAVAVAPPLQSSSAAAPASLRTPESAPSNVTAESDATEPARKDSSAGHQGTLGDADRTEVVRRDVSESRERDLSPDWKWTILLFQQEHSWHQVMQIRRMKDEELAASLCVALRSGAAVPSGWLNPPGDDSRTSGQQRVVREIRRRTAAGVQ